jgi:hypothetical protein
VDNPHTNTTSVNSNAVVYLILSFLSQRIHGLTKQQVVTILCKPASNLGAIRMTAAPLLSQVLEPLCETLEKSLKPDWQDGTNATTSYYQ